MARRQCDELLASAEKKRICAEREHANALLTEACEGSVDLSDRDGIQDVDLHPQRERRLLGGSRNGWRIRIIGIDEHTADNHVGDELVHQAERFLAQAAREKVYTGHIAAGPVEARDQAELNRVDAVGKDDRYRRRHPLRGNGRSGRTGGKDHSHLATNQIGGERGQPIVLAVGPAVFNRDIFAFDIARLFQAALECAHERTPLGGGRAAEESDHRHRGLLCAPPARPRRRACQSQHELAPPHLKRHLYLHAGGKKSTA